MKAIEFQNRYANVVKDFFNECLQNEIMPIRRMQDITMYCTDKGFGLRLETVCNCFTQEFEVESLGITPLYFEIH